MPNTPITMNKLRTIIRLYEDHTGLKSISSMSRSSRNTVKKYINKWNSLAMSYDEFQAKSDAELNELFCVAYDPELPNPRREELEALLPTICKDLGKKGMTTLKQWDKYIREHPDGYGLTQFRRVNFVFLLLAGHSSNKFDSAPASCVGCGPALPHDQ